MSSLTMKPLSSTTELQINVLNFVLFNFVFLHIVQYYDNEFCNNPLKIANLHFNRYKIFKNIFNKHAA